MKVLFFLADLAKYFSKENKFETMKNFQMVFKSEEMVLSNDIVYTLFD